MLGGGAVGGRRPQSGLLLRGPHSTGGHLLSSGSSGTGGCARFLKGSLTELCRPCPTVSHADVPLTSRATSTGAPCAVAPHLPWGPLLTDSPMGPSYPTPPGAVRGGPPTGAVGLGLCHKHRSFHWGGWDMNLGPLTSSVAVLGLAGAQPSGMRAGLHLGSAA